jgi:prolyl-tRNA synthetase
MKQSQLFTKTRKTAPKDEVSKNAELLIRAGYVYKEMAGVYTYLPLGLRVLENIKQVIREEMNHEGGQEIVMTALQDKQLWEKTDRWDDSKVDNWFKTKLKNGTEIGLAITHEEPLTRIMSEYISSYRDLPVYAYQFQNKFRNETRAKSGIMRGREFLMKDMYDFSRDESEHNEFYAQMRAAYLRVFKRVGIAEITYVTFASGGIFSQFSEEFQTVSEAGEDTIYVDEQTGISVNKEVYTDEILTQLGLIKENLIEKKSIETGNIFHLGTKFSESLGLSFMNEKEEKQPVYMGSYGLGPTRLMGTLVEVLSDDKGIVWPESVAPFRVHLLSLGTNEKSEEIYETLTASGIEVLYDDRDKGAGEKFADADLIGIPYQVIVGKRSLESGKAEVKNRATGNVDEVAFEDLATYLTN